jgi:cysteine desulfurase / selenocysteine lyase
MTDWQEVRAEFPALENWTFLNTATYGQLPRRAVQAIAQHFAHRDELACSDFLAWFDDADRLRATLARLIHADSRDIAFVPNASTALSVLMNGIDWQPGDRIVTLENEFPNNLYAPCLKRQAEFVQTGWDRFFDSVSTRTRLVILSMVNYSTGFRPPLEEIAEFLRPRGTLLYIDGTQGVGALQFDASRVRPAMLAVHGYKWMLAPTGAGFFYIDPEVRERIPPNVIGWRSHESWRRVDSLHHGAPNFPANAGKYEGGMIPHALLYAMEQSANMMLEIGPERIEGRVLALADGVREVLREAGADVDDGATPIVSGRFAHRDASALARSLKEQRILLSARHNHLRVSVHLYNNEADLERLRAALS